jgi:hypothetical protein
MAWNNAQDPIGPIIHMLTTIAAMARNQWRANDPVAKLNIAMGAIQLTLSGNGPIGWDVVDAIATKLATLANEGLDGFYSAVTWVQENPQDAATTGGTIVAIGLGLALVAFGGGLGALNEPLPVDEVARLPAAVQPAAELFADNMLAYVLLSPSRLVVWR